MWQIKSRALREKRLEKVWSVEHLAKQSGVSARTIGELERSDRAVRLATLEYLATALGVAPREIATQRKSDPLTHGKAGNAGDSAPPPPPGHAAAEPALRAYGPDVTELPKLTRLETLVAMEMAMPPRPPLPTKRGEVQRLTAKLYQDIFTAYLAHEGALAYVSGALISQRGMSREQAKLCGTKSGAAARFHFVYSVQPGHEVGMTVHTSDLAVTKQLQERVNRSAGAIVKVVVAPDEVAEKGGGFEFFMASAKTLRPWGLEVVEVVEGEREAVAEKPKVAKPARAKKKKRG